MVPSHVLLLHPEINNKSQNVRINSIVNKTFPTSVGVLAGYLIGNGIECRIFDEQVQPLTDRVLEQLIESLEVPRIIGLSTLTISSGRAYDMAERIKKIDPTATTIIGGIHPTVVPEEAFQVSTGVDIVVRGEGEEVLLQLCRNIIEGKDWRSVLGLTFRGPDGKLMHTPDAPLISNLDTIPSFPYHLFEEHLHAYPSFSGIIGSRGCPYKCTFCSSRSISGLKYRFHSTERVISEIKILARKYKQDSVHLMDDNIAVHRPHFKELCDAIVAEGLNKEVFFHGSMRGDNATNEILDWAKKANFKLVYFGLETGNERLMKIIDKGETLAQVVDAIYRAKAKEIAVGATVILGLPTETPKERKEVVKFVNDLPLDSIRFNTLTPYPGTPVFRHVKDTVNVQGQWENFGVQYMWEGDEIPYVPENNDRLELIYDTMFANFSNYLSFKGLKRMFTQRFAGGNVIKLKKSWFFQFAELEKISGAFFYLLARFIHVAVRVYFKRFLRLFTPSKPNLEPIRIDQESKRQGQEQAALHA